MLELKDVSVSYGPIQAVKGVSFSVKSGEIVALIGANGAGKTSLLRAISGLIPYQGSIAFQGKSLAGIAAHRLASRGIAHAPEGRGIFANLSVEENLDLGAWSVRDRSRYKKDLEHAFALFPRLHERRKQSAGTLSGGEQQMLAIARALMSHPALVLLDEPSLGLAPQMIERIFDVIASINREGKTVLLVEQNALQALGIAHQGVILETGRVATAGPAGVLLKSDAVRKAYLGV